MRESMEGDEKMREFRHDVTFKSTEIERYYVGLAT